MWLACNVIARKLATPGHHRAIKGEGSLVEPEALEGDGNATAEINGKAVRTESTSYRRENAEANKDDKQKVVVTF